MESGTSTYMFVFRESTPEVYGAMTAEERRAAMDRWNDWCDGLVARGALTQGHPLEEAGRVVSARGVRPVDGPFAEAKEVIGGYILLELPSLEEATAIAESCPNLPYGATVEVRPVATACHLARSLGWTTMREPVGA